MTANKIGLSGLFSGPHGTKTSYPLRSMDGKGHKLSSRKGALRSGLQPNAVATAWGSDEHILFDDKENNRNILVNQEVTVVTEDVDEPGKQPIKANRGLDI